MRVVRQQGARVSATFDTASAAGEGKKWIATKDCNVFFCCYQGGWVGGGSSVTSAAPSTAQVQEAFNFQLSNFE